MQKAGDSWEISPQMFWIFRKISGWEREINTAPKPSPEVAPSKMELAPFSMEVAPSEIEVAPF